MPSIQKNTLLFDSVHTDWFTYHIGGFFMPFSMRTKLIILFFHMSVQLVVFISIDVHCVRLAECCDDFSYELGMFYNCQTDCEADCRYRVHVVGRWSFACRLPFRSKCFLSKLKTLNISIWLMTGCKVLAICVIGTVVERAPQNSIPLVAIQLHTRRYISNINQSMIQYTKWLQAWISDNRLMAGIDLGKYLHPVCMWQWPRPKHFVHYPLHCFQFWPYQVVVDVCYKCNNVFSFSVGQRDYTFFCTTGFSCQLEILLRICLTQRYTIILRTWTSMKALSIYFSW